MIKNITTSKIRDFTDLKVWQEGHKLVLMIYKLTKTFPRDERFGLIDQLRRYVISITSNIAEGFGRHSYKEKIQFYYQAQGSLTELKNQVIIAHDVGYISKDEFMPLMEQADLVHKLLQGLITKSKSFLSNSNSLKS